MSRDPFTVGLSLTLAALSCSSAIAQDGLPFQIPAPPDSMSFGAAMASGGDVDGDGRDEFVIIDPDWQDTDGNTIGKFYCYSGLDGSLLWSDVGLGPNADRIGAAFLPGGRPGDRYALAVAIGSSEDTADNHPGELRLYNGENDTILWSVSGAEDVFEMGTRIAAVGDLTDDDISEIAVPAAMKEDASLRIFNGADGSLVAEIKHIDYPFQVAPAGDITGDRVPDILVASHREFGDLGPNEVILYSGSSGAKLFAFTDPDDENGFGSSISGGVDITEDTYPDVLVGRANLGLDAAFLFSGRNGKLLRRFDNPDDPSHRFATWVGFGNVIGKHVDEILISGESRTYAYRSSDVDPFRYWWSVPVVPGVIFGTEHAVGDVNGDGWTDVLGYTEFGGIPAVNIDGGSLLNLSFDIGQPPQEPIFAVPTEVDFAVSGTDPSSRVLLYASRTGSTCTFIDRLGICMDLKRPLRYLGTHDSDETGTALISLHIPNAAPPGPAWFQALELNHRRAGAVTSNVMQAEIVE